MPFSPSGIPPEVSGNPKFKILQNFRSPQEPQGRPRHTGGVGALGDGFCLSCQCVFVLATVPEDADFVVEPSLEEPAVKRCADVATGRQIVGYAGAQDEIEVMSAGQLLHAEWDLEFSNLKLEVSKIPKVQLDVAPGRNGSPAAERISKFPLDFIFELFEESALQSETHALHVELAFIGCKVGRKSAKIALNLCAKVDAQNPAEAQRRFVFEHEADARVFVCRLVLSGQRQADENAEKEAMRPP